MKKILFCVLAITLLLLVGCKKAEETTEPLVTEPVVTEPVEPAVETIEEPAAVVETVSGALDMISEARCLDNRIEATVTNPTEQTFILGNTAKVIINGLIVSDPECDKLELGPGESVYCSDISGHLAIRQGKVNRIQINMMSERGISDVNCIAE